MQKPIHGRDVAKDTIGTTVLINIFYIKEIGALERIRTSDRLVRRTNKNAGIIVITGLAFVAFAGLCITYQD